MMSDSERLSLLETDISYLTVKIASLSDQIGKGDDGPRSIHFDRLYAELGLMIGERSELQHRYDAIYFKGQPE